VSKAEDVAEGAGKIVDEAAVVTVEAETEVGELKGGLAVVVGNHGKDAETLLDSALHSSGLPPFKRA
jgi:hypothetical protein